MNREAGGQQEFWETGGLYRKSDHPVVELFARQRVDYLAKRGLLGDVRSLLDVGAGSGFSSAYYPDSIRVVASDHAAGMLAGNPVRDRVRASATHLPFADGAFDVVGCWELLHHLDDPVAALRDMWRVARRRLIVFEPNRINPGHIVLGLTREEERKSLLFSPGHVRRLVRAATGRAVRPQRCGLLFPNVTPLALARLLVRLPYRVPLIAISQLVVVEKS
ncbi:MAG: class I SAM-dependent methyltransferase [Deltaproteobacteria bacterium]|nr:class I SAM-dependent methyltransferase [Deltaproteobacteria bacterium]